MSVFRVDPERLVLPLSCACCGATPAASKREARADGAAVIVPYCEECHRHVSKAGTHALAAAFSSSLLALTLAAALPLVWGLPQSVYVFSVLAFTALPPVLVLGFSRRRSVGHSSAARAVWWIGEGRLACASHDFAAALSRTNAIDFELEARRAPRVSRLAAIGLGVALVGIAVFYPAHYPVLRILNLTGELLFIFCDGRELATVVPTSQESASAGVEVRLPAGTRRLWAETSDGKRVGSVVTEVQGRAQHVYAPGSDGTCFWLERTTYGRDASPAEDGVEPLLPSSGFLTLPEAVDTWFSPNPRTAKDARSSGGRLISLRQAACPDAPAEVRRALSSRSSPQESFASPTE